MSSWEVNSFSVTQITSILWHQKDHYPLRKTALWISILSQIIPIQTLDPILNQF
jgi:hypothetical protein